MIVCDEDQHIGLKKITKRFQKISNNNIDPLVQHAAGEMNMELLKGNAKNVSELLKVMSNEWRLLILCHLTFGEQSVGQLEKLLGIGQSALSQHLAVLRREKIVSTRHSAQFIFYALDSNDAKVIMTILYERFCITD